MLRVLAAAPNVELEDLVASEAGTVMTTSAIVQRRQIDHVQSVDLIGTRAKYTVTPVPAALGRNSHSLQAIRF